MGTGEGVTETSVEIVSNPRRHLPHPRYASSSQDVKVGFCTCISAGGAWSAEKWSGAQTQCSKSWRGMGGENYIESCIFYINLV